MNTRITRTLDKGVWHHAITILSNYSAAIEKGLLYRIELFFVWILIRIKTWRLELEKRQMLKMIQELPEEIQHDIGWPCRWW